MPLTSINPTTGEELHRYEEMDPTEVVATVERVDAAQRAWATTDFGERAERIRAAAEILRSGREEYARLMALEMGKPLAGGRAEIDKCARVCDYYAERAASFLADEPVETDGGRSFVAYRPLGVVLAVMPWNFPFWQVFRFAAPALMAGNGGVLKHASNVVGCALATEEVLRRAGLPEDLFRALPIGSGQVAAVIDHPRVRAVTLTGSGAAGRAVAERAGSRLKKTVLELGGSDAYVVLEDAELEGAASTCVESRLLNSGQSCVAAKRFVVVEAVRERFEELMVSGMRSAVMGDPLAHGVTVGPQARVELRDELHQQVTASLEQGARLLLGGEIPAGPGAFYPPTVLTDVRPGMPAFDEELFGPVAAIISARDEDEAIALANDSVFGLGSAVFTADRERGERIAADRLEAGNCFVNALVRSDPKLPFGGIKESGYGRELSHFGIREFVNVKTVCVA